MAIKADQSIPSQNTVIRDRGSSSPIEQTQQTIPAYEQNAQGEFVYNPNNTAGIPNVSNTPINTQSSKYSKSSSSESVSSESKDDTTRDTTKNTTTRTTKTDTAKDNVKDNVTEPIPAVSINPKTGLWEYNPQNTANIPESEVFDRIQQANKNLVQQKVKAKEPVTSQQRRVYERDLELNYTKLPDNQYISNEQFRALASTAESLGYDKNKYQDIALKQGYGEMQKAIESDIKEFESKHVPLKDNKGNITYIPVEDFNRLYEYDKEHGTNYQSIAINKGYEAMQKTIDEDIAKQERALNILKPYESSKSYVSDSPRKPETISVSQLKTGKITDKAPVAYDISKFVTDMKKHNVSDTKIKNVLSNAGFDKKTIEIYMKPKETKPIDTTKKWMDTRTGETYTDKELAKTFDKYSAERDYIVRTREGIKAIPEETRELRQQAEQVATIAAEAIVPGLYVGKNWNTLTPAEKGLWIGIDALSLVPFAGAAVRGARVIGTTGRAARLKSAAKGIAAQAAAEAIAPVNLLIHPVSSTKTAVREIANIAENILDIRKLPETVITTSRGTIRIKLDELTTPEEAMAIRDKLMSLAAKGERPIVQIGDQTIELTRSPLMKELKGGLVHTTPQGEAFEGGLTVATKPGIPAKEQGLFLSPEPLPRFTGSSAFGNTGDKRLIFITSRETAEEAIPTAKLYNSSIGKVAELENKLAVEARVKPPKQKLYTRIGADGQLVEIWLQTPLTKKQILKLKTKGISETFKTIWTEPIRIKGKGIVKGISYDEVDDIARVLRQSGNTNQARQLVRAYALSNILRKRPVSIRESIRTRIDTDKVRHIKDRIDRQVENIRRAELTSTRTARADNIIDISEIRTPRTDRTEDISRIDRIDNIDRIDGVNLDSSDITRKTIDKIDHIDRVNRVDIPRSTDIPKVPKLPRVPITKLSRLQTNSPMSQPIPDGSIAFAMGNRKGAKGISVPQWYYIPPPYTQRKPISLSAPPTGALNTGSNSPYDTIQIIGRSRKYSVPKEVNIDMGITDINIKNGKEISFKSKGTKTNVGTRIESPTKGMSIENEVDEFPGVVERKGINRTTMSKKQPSRKANTKKREDWIENLTSLKGIRW